MSFDVLQKQFTKIIINILTIGVFICVLTYKLQFKYQECCDRIFISQFTTFSNAISFCVLICSFSHTIPLLFDWIYVAPTNSNEKYFVRQNILVSFKLSFGLDISGELFYFFDGRTYFGSFMKSRVQFMNFAWPICGWIPCLFDYISKQFFQDQNESFKAVTAYNFIHKMQPTFLIFATLALFKITRSWA